MQLSTLDYIVIAAFLGLTLFIGLRFRKQPLFACNQVVEKYPVYTPDMFASDVAFKPKKHRSKYNPSRENGKVSYLAYLRSQVSTFLNSDKHTEMSLWVNIFYMMDKNRNKPYGVPFSAEGKVVNYYVSKRYTREQLMDLSQRVLAACDTHDEIFAFIKKDSKRWYFGG